jgi:uncharacterized protein with FMN-binding domain
VRRAVASVATVIAVILPVDAATAAVRSAHKVVKRVVTVRKRVVGTQGDAGQWGNVEVTLVVRKTTTTVNSRKTVRRRIVSVGVPVYPDHTGRSIFINQQALPILEQEVLQAQFNPNIEMVSGATYTSNGFAESLQAALLEAKRV